MTIHTIIESLSAYEAVRAQDPVGERVWWTTGAAVLAGVSAKGGSVHSLERNLSQDEFNRLAEAGYAFAHTLGEELNRLCVWRGYADIGAALGFTLNQVFFVTLYKGLLLSRLLGLAANDGARVECVGDPNGASQNGLSLIYGRFDTLYAVLARFADSEMIEVYRHTIPKGDLEAKHRNIVDRRMGAMEKFLSIMNNTPGSFFFKAWKSVVNKKWFPFKGVRLWPFVRRRFYIYGSCELLDETFLRLLRLGGSVRLLKRLPKVAGNPEVEVELPGAQTIEASCTQCANNALREAGIDSDPILDASVSLITSRLLAVLAKLHASHDELTAGYGRIIEMTGRDAWILTGGLFSVEDRLFHDYCRTQGVKVVAFEHGVTMGLSRWTDYCDRYYGMRHADVGVYHNELAADQMAGIVPDQQRIVAGLPKVTLGIGSRALKKRVARRWLGIDGDEHVVIYVAELEKNNYVYGPYIDTDLQYAQKTEGVVRALCSRFPRSRVILKLYPTERYVDSHEFGGLSEEYENLQIIKDMDFRFVSAAADLIVTSSAQSTLGWVVGSGVPCLFAEFEWAPAHVDGLRMECSDIPGLTALVAMDSPQFIQNGDPAALSALFH